MCAMCLAAVQGGAQGRQASALDSQTRQPVPFAAIYYPDYKTSALSDSSGRFALPNSKAAAALTQITAVGYKTYLGMLPLNDTIAAVYLEASAHELQEIVVAASGSRLQGENVLNVEKLTLADNSALQGISLADKLTAAAGVSSITTGAGIGKPVIRGISGSRIAVYVQGLRLENQQWGGEHGLGYDDNGIRQAEIIKGPASLLYGGDALGGVIALADHPYAPNNTIQIARSVEYHSGTNGWRTNGGIRLSKGRLHFNNFVGFTDHNDYKDGNGTEVDNSRFRTFDVKSTAGYTGSRSVGAIKYNFLKERFGLLPHTEEEGGEEEADEDGAPPYQELHTHIAGLEHTIFLDNNAKINIDAGYIYNSRKEYGHHHSEHGEGEEHEHEEGEEPEPHDDDHHAHADGSPALDMTLHTAQAKAQWSAPIIGSQWTLTAGAQGMMQVNRNSGAEVLIPNARTAEAGAYALANFHYGNNAYVQAGARINGRSINGEAHGTEGEEEYIAPLNRSYFAFNFSAGVYQPLAQLWSLRLNIASGWRAPNMYELLSNGVHEGANRYERGNPTLQTEMAYQADASLNFRTLHVEAFVNPYCNYIRNYIYLLPTDEQEDGVPVYNYAQTGALLYGGEAGLHFHPHPLDWLHIEASYSTAMGADADGTPLPLMPAQKINATAHAAFVFARALRKVSVHLHNSYVLAQRRIAEYESETPAYNLLGAGITFLWAIPTGSGSHIPLQAGVQISNLLNEAYYDHLSRYKPNGILNMGRSIVIKISVPLSFKI